MAACDARSVGLGTLAALPDDLIQELLLPSLDVRGLLALSQASRLCRLLCQEEPLWLVLHLQRCRRPFCYRVGWGAPQGG